MSIHLLRRILTAIVFCCLINIGFSAEKRLMRFETTEDHCCYILSYDDVTGRVASISVTGIDGRWDSEDDYTVTIDWSEFHNGIVAVSSDSKTGYLDDGNLTLHVNEDGLLTHVDAFGDLVEYALNNEGFCEKIYSQEYGEVYGSYSWENGNLLRCDQDYKQIGLFYSGKTFVEPVESKCVVVGTFFNSYAGELSAPVSAIFAGLVKGNRDLLDHVEFIGYETDMEYYLYEFDDDGYPTVIEQWTDSGTKPYAVFKLSWEENPFGSINENSQDESDIVQEYYTIDGLAHKTPVKGVNIYRDKKGNVYKVLIP